MDVLSFFGLGSDFHVIFEFDDASSRPMMTIQANSQVRYFPIYQKGESIQGNVVCTPDNHGEAIEFDTMTLELVGEIVTNYARDKNRIFTRESLLLEKNDKFSEKRSFSFRFETPDMPYESYSGTNAEVRYFLKFTCSRSFSADMVRQFNLWVINFSPPPEINAPIKMEVGIEDMLHLEFEYDRCRYHLDDTIVGKIYFLMVRIRLKYMLLEVIKREVIGTPPNVVSEIETLAQYEVMDGVPIRGESIPVRLHLGWIVSLTPSYTTVHDLVSVRYSLNLVLVDEDDRRYFKQTPILLWRQQPGQAVEG